MFLPLLPQQYARHNTGATTTTRKRDKTWSASLFFYNVLYMYYVKLNSLPLLTRKMRNPCILHWPRHSLALCDFFLSLGLRYTLPSISLLCLLELAVCLYIILFLHARPIRIAFRLFVLDLPFDFLLYT